MVITRTLTALLAAALAVSLAPAESLIPDDGALLIVNSRHRNIGVYDPHDGSYLGDIISDAQRLDHPAKVVLGPDGNLWVSSQGNGTIQIYDTKGQFVRTFADSSDGLSNNRGITFHDDLLYVCMYNQIARFDLDGNRLPDLTDDMHSFDLLVQDDGRLLVAKGQPLGGDIRRYHPDGSLDEVLFDYGFPVQVQRLDDGNFLTSGIGAGTIIEFTESGQIVRETIWSPFPTAAHSLGNGDYIVSFYDGVAVVRPDTGQTIRFVRLNITGRFITFVPGQKAKLPADLNGDGVVDGMDLAILLTSWGPCPEPPASCAADISGDGVVDGVDLAILLTSWS